MPRSNLPYNPVPTWEQSNPVLTGYGQSQQMYGNALKNALAETQAQYAPQLAQADVASKTAYAQYAPVQPLAQLLSNPLVWSTLQPDQLNSLTNMLSGALGNAGIQGFGQQQQRMPQEQPQQIQELPSFQPQEQQGGARDLGGIFSGNPGRQQDMPPLPAPRGTQIQGNTLGLPNTPTNRLTQSSLAPGVVGGINPLTATQAQTDAYKIASNKQAEAEATGWEKQKTDNIVQAEGATDAIRELESLHAAFKGLGQFEKGPLFGNIPSVSTPAQILEKGQERLRNAITAASNKGHITDEQRKQTLAAIPGRKLTDESENALVNSLSGMYRRQIERADFDADIEQRYPTLTNAQRNKVWRRYISERNYYDPESHQLLEENLNTWGDYLTPEAIQEVLSKPSANAHKPLKKQAQDIRQMNGKHYIQMNGEWFEQ